MSTVHMSIVLCLISCDKIVNQSIVCGETSESRDIHCLRLGNLTA